MKLLFSSNPKHQLRGTAHGIYLLDTETRKCQLMTDKSTMGIEVFEDGYICSSNINDDTNTINIFDKNFNIVNTFEAGRCLHDVVLYNNEIYVIDSSYDSILKFNFDGKLIAEIYPLPKEKNQKYHINCFKVYEDHFYISMFSLYGQKTNADMHTESDGAIIKFNPHSEKIVDIVEFSLKQPHSIFFQNDLMYFVESGRGTVRNSDEIIFQLDNFSFPKGLAIKDNLMIIGQNNNYKIDQGFVQSNIVVFDMITKETIKIPVPVYAIYDIKII